MDAPHLPPDTTGATSLHHLTAADFSAEDAALTCEKIDTERHALQTGVDQANAHIAENRRDNQIAGYIGAALFLPALLATEGNYSDKDFIKLAYQRMDILDKLAVLRTCKQG